MHVGGAAERNSCQSQPIQVEAPKYSQRMLHIVTLMWKRNVRDHISHVPVTPHLLLYVLSALQFMVVYSLYACRCLLLNYIIYAVGSGYTWLTQSFTLRLPRQFKLNPFSQGLNREPCSSSALKNVFIRHILYHKPTMTLSLLPLCAPSVIS